MPNIVFRDGLQQTVDKFWCCESCILNYNKDNREGSERKGEIAARRRVFSARDECMFEAKPALNRHRRLEAHLFIKSLS